MSDSTVDGIGVQFKADLSDFNAAMKSAAAAVTAATAGMSASGTAANTMAAGATRATTATNALGTATKATTGAVNTFNITINQAAQAVARTSGAIRAHNAAIGSSRMAYMEFGHSAKAVTDQLIAGQSPFRAFSMEAPRLAQAFLELNPAMMSTVGIIAVVGGAIIAAGLAIMEHINQVRNLQAVYADMGNMGGTSVQSIRQDIVDVAESTNDWQSNASATLQVLARIPGTTRETQRSLALTAEQMRQFSLNSVSAEDNAKDLQKAIEGGAASAKRFLADQNQLYNHPGLGHLIDEASAEGDFNKLAQLIQSALIDKMNLGTEAIKENHKALADLQEQMGTYQFDGFGFSPGALGGPQMGDREARNKALEGAPPPDMSAQRDQATVDRATPELAKRQALTNQIKQATDELTRAQAALGAATQQENSEAIAGAHERISAAQAAISNLTAERNAIVGVGTRTELGELTRQTEAASRAAAAGQTAYTGLASTLKGITIPPEYQKMVEQSAATHGVPLPVLGETLQMENHFQNTTSQTPVTKKDGSQEYATGVGQFLPSTAAGRGFDPHNVGASIDQAGAYLKELHDKLGSWDKAVASYGTFSPTQGSHSSAKQGEFDRTVQANGVDPGAGGGTSGAEAPTPSDLAAGAGGVQQTAQIALNAKKAELQQALSLESQNAEEIKKLEDGVAQATIAANNEIVSNYKEQAEQRIALARGNASAVLPIEQDLLAKVKAVVGEQSPVYRQLYDEMPTFAQRAADREFDVEMAKLRRIETEERRSAAQRIAIAQQIASATSQHYGPDSTQSDAAQQQLAKAQQQATQEQANTQAQALEAEVAMSERAAQQEISALQFKLQMHQITSAQELAGETATLSQLVSITDRAYTQIAAIYVNDTQKAAEATNKKVQAEQQAQDKLTQLTQQAALKQQTAYDQTAQRIGSTMGSALSQILVHHQTLASVVQQTTIKMADQFVTASAQMATKWIADQLRSLVMTQATQAATTTAVATGAAAQGAAQDTARIQSAAVAATTNTSTIGGDAAKAAAGTYSSVAQIPYVGWILAPAAAAAAFVAVMAFGSGISSAAGGWDRVPQDGMMTELHKNEMVLPAHIANPLRESVGNWNMPPAGQQGGSGSMGMNNTSNQMSSTYNLHYAPSIGGGGGGMTKRGAQGFFNTHSGALVDSLKEAHRTSALKIPRRS